MTDAADTPMTEERLSMLLKREMVASLAEFADESTPFSKMLPKGAISLIAHTVKSGQQRTFTGSLIDHFSRSLARAICSGKVPGMRGGRNAKKP